MTMTVAPSAGPHVKNCYPGVMRASIPHHGTNAYHALGQARPRMDVTVTRAAGYPRAWTLTDLLGRPMGRITEDRGGGFTIDAHERAPRAMAELVEGPY